MIALGCFYENTRHCSKFIDTLFALNLSELRKPFQLFNFRREFEVFSVQIIEFVNGSALKVLTPFSA